MPVDDHAMSCLRLLHVRWTMPHAVRGVCARGRTKSTCETMHLFANAFATDKCRVWPIFNRMTA